VKRSDAVLWVGDVSVTVGFDPDVLWTERWSGSACPVPGGVKPVLVWAGTRGGVERRLRRAVARRRRAARRLLDAEVMEATW
jgi:hypothetical protein